jgi:hypothetical protein
LFTAAAGDPATALAVVPPPGVSRDARAATFTNTSLLVKATNTASAPTSLAETAFCPKTDCSRLELSARGHGQKLTSSLGILRVSAPPIVMLP